MALFKCKMCGGDLIIDKGSTVAECEYCGLLPSSSKPKASPKSSKRRTKWSGRAE